MATSTKKSAKTDEPVEPVTTDAETRDVYVLPVVHAEVPGRLVNAGFWGGLTGAVVLGVVDLPLGLLLGAGVAVARHRTRRADAG